MAILDAHVTGTMVLCMSLMLCLQHEPSRKGKSDRACYILEYNALLYVLVYLA